MASLTYLLAALCLYSSGSCGEIVMTQTPNYVSVSPGDTVIVSCKSSDSVYHTGVKYEALAWLQQKPGQAPKLILDEVTKRPSGITERFNGSGSGTDFTLTIKGITEDDAADYYCMQYRVNPITFGQKTTVDIKRREDATPSVSIFGPSEDELKTGKATAVCLVDKFYPADAKVSWKADNNVVPSDAVKDSEKMKDVDNTYSMSSIFTTSSDEFKKYNVISCEVTHKTLPSAVVKTFKTTEC